MAASSRLASKHNREASDAIHQVMLHYADAYEPISLDEAFLDISGMGSQYPTLGSIGRAIKEEIRCAVHLTASVGIAPNKFLAKMASDMNKPDGLCIIPTEESEASSHPFPCAVFGAWAVSRRKNSWPPDFAPSPTSKRQRRKNSPPFWAIRGLC